MLSNAKKKPGWFIGQEEKDIVKEKIIYAREEPRQDVKDLSQCPIQSPLILSKESGMSRWLSSLETISPEDPTAGTSDDTQSVESWHTDSTKTSSKKQYRQYRKRLEQITLPCGHRLIAFEEFSPNGRPKRSRCHLCFAHTYYYCYECSRATNVKRALCVDCPCKHCLP